MRCGHGLGIVEGLRKGVSGECLVGRPDTARVETRDSEGWEARDSEGWEVRDSEVREGRRREACGTRRRGRARVKPSAGSSV